MDFSFTFSGPAKVIFGKGASKQLGAELKALGIKRVLLITDPGLRKAGIVEELERILKSETIDYQIFDNVDPNPTAQNVEEGTSIFQKLGAQGVVGLGGGSSIDTAKAIALVNMTGASIDYLLEKEVPSLKNRIPVIALPTTAGTGSEVTTASMIKDRAKKRKALLRDPSIKPTVAICDPLLTLTLPPRITKASGIDALAHALGSYTNTAFNPIVEMGDLEAIRLISENLPLIASRGGNVEARTSMMYASLLAGIGISNTGNDLNHGMATPIEGVFNCIHGEACGVLLPYSIEFTLMGNPKKFAQIAKAMGESVEGLSVRESSGKAVSAVNDLLTRIGMPKRLRDLGVEKEKIQELAKLAIGSRSTQLNARAITLEEMVALYERAY
jgi:alcohol dehydrogenase class IV